MLKALARILVLLPAVAMALGCCAAPAWARADGDAKNALENGNYDQAITIVVGKLKQKRSHQDNIALLEEAIPKAFEKHQASAGAAATAGRWETALHEYSVIVSLNKLLTGMGPVMKEVEGKKDEVPTPMALADAATMEGIDSKLKAAMGAAEEQHYQAGMKFEKAADATEPLRKPESFRRAAGEYKLACQFEGAYKDAKDKYDFCKEKGTITVAIMDFEDKTGKGQGLNDVIKEKVLAEALNAEFVKFVTKEYVDQIKSEQGKAFTDPINPTTAVKVGELLGIHAFVFGKLLQIITNFPQDIKQCGRNSTILKDYSTKPPTDVPVACSYCTYTRQGRVKVQASYQVVDVATRQIKGVQNIQREVNDNCCWLTFEGNKEAVPYEASQKCPGEERALKSPEEMANDAANSLGTELGRSLQNLYK